jgi:membrane protein YdbS with pleckstrin-like domain
MAQEFPSPIPPGPGPVQEFPAPPAATPPKKNNTVWIVVAIVVVLLCCCCVAVAGWWLWNNGDKFMNEFPSSFLPLVSSYI